MTQQIWKNNNNNKLDFTEIKTYSSKNNIGGSDGKESTQNAGDLGLIPGLGRCPGGGHGNPLQYSCLENPHGQRSLVGCSHRVTESDMTEVTILHFHCEDLGSIPGKN